MAGLGGIAGIFRILTLVFGLIALALAAASLAPNWGGYYSSEGAQESLKVGVLIKYGYPFVPPYRKYMALCTDFTIAVFHLSVVITTFIASLTSLVLFFIGASQPENSKTVCVIYHLLAGFLLMAGGAGWMIGYFIFPPYASGAADLSVGRLHLQGGCGRLMIGTDTFGVVQTILGGFENIVTASFGILDGIVYIITGFIIWKFSSDSAAQKVNPEEQATDSVDATAEEKETPPDPDNSSTQGEAAV